MQLTHLADFPKRNKAPIPWVDKVPDFPWDDISFSTRMLREHLNQSHNLASRRQEIQNQQISWMEDAWFKPGNVKSVLDLTCGPGLIGNELARRGYKVTGIDVSPAAIGHAISVAEAEGLDVEYSRGDIREVEYGSNYDAAIMTYGLPSSFSRAELLKLLRKVNDALAPTGLAVLEFVSIPQMKHEVGRTWHTRTEGGLFGQQPYLYLRESTFHDDAAAGCQMHYIIRMDTSEVEEYSICYQGYELAEVRQLAEINGFRSVTEFGSLEGEQFTPESDWLVAILQK